MKLGTLALPFIIFFQATTFAQALSLQAQYEYSRAYMLQNISRSDAAPGSVVASASKVNPNYYFHWVRDAALVMDQVVSFYRSSQSSQEKQGYLGLLTNYVSFSRRNQTTPNRSGGLGEPKFNVDGSAFNGDWGRPQNDGPALRALTLMNFAKILMTEGQQSYVRNVLYDGKISTDSVIKSDLEFVAHHWPESSFDLWEEVRGHHFYTLMVQRRALSEGAQFASALGDPGAGSFYIQQAGLITQALKQFWDGSRGYLVATVGQDGGLGYKTSGLDVAVVLGSLHGASSDGFLSPSNDLVIATAEKLRQAFQQIYPINQTGNLATAIGRYPEDHYNGYTTDSQGNPWFLATLSYAELYYRMRFEFIQKGVIQVTPLNAAFFGSLGAGALTPGLTLTSNDQRFQIILSGLTKAGDEFVRTVFTHAGPNGSLSEQFNGNTGFMQGAENLTWSHASFLSVASWRFRR